MALTPLSSTSPAMATCRYLGDLLTPAVDSLLRPWHKPGDLLAALAEKIAEGGGEGGTAGEPRIAGDEKARVSQSGKTYLHMPFGVQMNSSSS